MKYKLVIFSNLYYITEVVGFIAGYIEPKDEEKISYPIVRRYDDWNDGKIFWRDL